MDERSSRIFVGLCMLVLVWIGIYWMWQPAHQQKPSITFDTTPINVPSDSTDSTDSTDPADQPLTGDTSSPIVVPTQQSVATQSVVVPPAKLIAPEFFEHVVQPNELMQTIAKHYFGSIDDWTVIAKSNPKIDPRKLRPGMVLRIPRDKTNIQGKLDGEPKQPGVITPHTGSDSKVIEYIVQSGDSLSVISQRIYGSSLHARFIFESNRDTLRSMDSISIGQLLKLPPLPQTKPDP